MNVYHSFGQDTEHLLCLLLNKEIEMKDSVKRLYNESDKKDSILTHKQTDINSKQLY
jgi:hypothetical protein